MGATTWKRLEWKGGGEILESSETRAGGPRPRDPCRTAYSTPYTPGSGQVGRVSAGPPSFRPLIPQFNPCLIAAAAPLWLPGARQTRWRRSRVRGPFVNRKSPPPDENPTKVPKSLEHGLFCTDLKAVGALLRARQSPIVERRRVRFSRYGLLCCLTSRFLLTAFRSFVTRTRFEYFARTVVITIYLLGPNNLLLNCSLTNTVFRKYSIATHGRYGRWHLCS